MLKGKHLKEYLEGVEKEKVEKDTKLKKILVDYVGKKLNPENGEITVEMIVEIMAKEFPEFVLVVGENNFMIGYEQALADIKDVSENMEKFEEKKETKNKGIQSGFVG